MAKVVKKKWKIKMPKIHQPQPQTGKILGLLVAILILYKTSWSWKVCLFETKNVFSNVHSSLHNIIYNSFRLVLILWRLLNPAFSFFLDPSLRHSCSKKFLWRLNSHSKKEITFFLALTYLVQDRLKMSFIPNSVNLVNEGDES